MESKKKRSPNYTLDEKQKLLSLVAKYTGIIECKRTGALFLNKKNEAWAAITKRYNILFPTNQRDVGMLKHFYNNIKHRARKNSDILNKHTSHAEMPIESVLEDEENSTINSESELMDPILIDPVVMLLEEQVQSNGKPLDEAAEYFGGTEENIMDDISPVPERIDKKHMIPITRRKALRNSRMQSKKTSIDLLTKIYLKKKIDLVFYQKRNEELKHKHEQEKHELELKKQGLHVQILKAQLKSAEMDLIKKYQLNSNF